MHLFLTHQTSSLAVQCTAETLQLFPCGWVTDWELWLAGTAQRCKWLAKEEIKIQSAVSAECGFSWTCIALAHKAKASYVKPLQVGDRLHVQFHTACAWICSEYRCFPLVFSSPLPSSVPGTHKHLSKCCMNDERVRLQGWNVPFSLQGSS